MPELNYKTWFEEYMAVTRLLKEYIDRRKTARLAAVLEKRGRILQRFESLAPPGAGTHEGRAFLKKIQGILDMEKDMQSLLIAQQNEVAADAGRHGRMRRRNKGFNASSTVSRFIDTRQ